MPIVQAYSEKLRRQLTDLLARVYRTLAPQKAAQLLNLDAQQVTPCAFLDLACLSVAGADIRAVPACWCSCVTRQCHGKQQIWTCSHSISDHVCFQRLAGLKSSDLPWTRRLALSAMSCTEALLLRRPAATRMDNEVEHQSPAGVLPFATPTPPASCQLVMA